MSRKKIDHTFSVAPMMECTDRHCRYYMRLLTKRSVLYTEMVTAQAVIHGDRTHLLGFDPVEQPIVLQLGGSDPALLAKACKIAADWGYNEINLNVGCPSSRVKSGNFGACLMKDPALVAQCVESMQEVVDLPVTVKCRLGVDNQDEEEATQALIEQVSGVGCETFIIHARKAWLKGLSPKQNRHIPPLNYDLVYKIKRLYPHLQVILNGGIDSIDQCNMHLAHVDGVMLGRAAYHNAYLLASVDSELYADSASVISREAVWQQMQEYIAERVKEGAVKHRITRHLVGLYHGQPHARQWRSEMTSR